MVKSEGGGGPLREAGRRLLWETSTGSGALVPRETNYLQTEFVYLLEKLTSRTWAELVSLTEKETIITQSLFTGPIN